MKFKNENIKGIFYICMAMLTFVAVNTLAKDVVVRYPLVQVGFFRNFFALLCLIPLVFRSGGVRILHPQGQLPRLFIMGIIGAIAMVCLFGSLRMLPLATAVTIHFTETFIITALSALILKEFVGVHRWVAVFLGFIGVMIMMRPTGDVINLGALFALIFAIGDAIYITNARIMSRSMHSVAIVIYFSAIVSICLGITLPFYWEPVPFEDLMILITLGIGGAVGQLFITNAYKHGEPAVVAPMTYTALIWSLLFGFIFYGEVPDSTLFAGGFFIVSSGLYIIYRESRNNKMAVDS